MRKLATLSRVLFLALGLVFAAGSAAQAQEAAPASSFDAYRAVAVTAGVVGGAVVATIVTDGLIIPAYAMATGAEGAAGMAAFGGGAMGGGANGMIASFGHQGYQFFRGSMRLLGAVSGGLYADAWYTGN